MAISIDVKPTINPAAIKASLALALFRSGIDLVEDPTTRAMIEDVIGRLENE